MRDAEGLAREAVEELARDRLARGEADRMHEAVEAFRPGLLQAGEQGLDLLVAADVAVEDELRAELGGGLGDAILEALAHVAEGELGALPMAGTRDAIGDRAVVQNARDEQALAGEESHAAVSGLLIPRGLSHRHGCRYGSCRL